MQNNNNAQGVDDLVAHFENFNMEDLGASGSPTLQRSMTERNPLSPPRDDKNKVELNSSLRRELKYELDQKKVRLLELETENGELKTLIEQMTKDAKIMKSKVSDGKDAGENEQVAEQVYELRRENFRLAADVRRLQLDNEMLRSDERAKRQEAPYQEISKLENRMEDLKAEKMELERDNSKLLSKIRQLDAQLITVKQERDRLLEISSDLKVQVTQSEKRKFIMSNYSQAQSERRDDGNLER